MERMIKDNKCSCIFRRIKEVKDNNGNKILKCKKCGKVIFSEDYSNLEERIGITRSGLGINDN